MTDYIYSRVSTDRQDTRNQVESLYRKYPGAVIVEEVDSGVKSRPRLRQLIGELSEGDRLIVVGLDRLGRGALQLLGLVESLHKRGVILISDREGIDYGSISGRFMTQILCSLAEMERQLISERTKAALAAKRAQGKRLGRPPRIPPSTIRQVLELKAEGRSVRDIARECGISIGRVSQLSTSSRGV